MKPHPFTQIINDWLLEEKGAKNAIFEVKRRNARTIGENKKRREYNTQLYVENNARVEVNRVARAEYESDVREWREQREKMRAKGQTMKSAGEQPRLTVLLPEKPLKPLPMQHSISDETKRILNRETETLVALKNMTPQQWVLFLDLIGDIKIRTRCANIIWWDFFGDKQVKERSAELDEYLSQPFHEARESDICLALTICGYTPKMARARMRGVETANAERIHGGAGLPNQPKTPTPLDGASC